MNDEPIIDLEWRKLTARAKTAIPDDEDLTRELLELYQSDGVSPRGCAITNGTSINQQWVCKMYLGGKQRILGYGTVYQCARLYDAAFWRFRQYRTERSESAGQVYNFSEASAGDDNMQADIVALLCDMEDLLKSRGLLKTSEQRETEQRQRKSEYQHARYTAKGRVEQLTEYLIELVEAQALAIADIKKQLDGGNIIQRVLSTPPKPRPGYVEEGPGYVAPYIGDDPNAPSITC